MTNLEHDDGEKENISSFEVLTETEDYVEFRIDKSIINISQSNDGFTFGYRLETQPHSAVQKITMPESQVVEIIAVVVKEMGESLVEEISASLAEGMGETFAKEIGEGIKEFTKEFPLAILGAAIGMIVHASTKDTKNE